MNNEKRPIHQLFVGEATVMEVGSKPAGRTKMGKDYPAKIFVEVKTSDDRWMAIDFKSKNDFDDKKLKKLLAFFGLTEVKQLPTIKGKTMAIFVAPTQWQDKIFWNVKDFFDVKYLKDPLEAALGDFEGFGESKTGTDEIPF